MYRSSEDPDGNIVMSIAENRLTVDLIKTKLQFKPSFPDSVFFYDNNSGSAKLKAAMVGLMQHTFMQVYILRVCMCHFVKPGTISNQLFEHSPRIHHPVLQAFLLPWQCSSCMCTACRDSPSIQTI